LDSKLFNYAIPDVRLTFCLFKGARVLFFIFEKKVLKHLCVHQIFFRPRSFFLRQVQRTTHILMNDAAGDTLIHLNKHTGASLRTFSYIKRVARASGGAAILHVLRLPLNVAFNFTFIQILICSNHTQTRAGN